MSGRRRKLRRILEAAERGEAVPMQAGYWLAHEWVRMESEGRAPALRTLPFPSPSGAARVEAWQRLLDREAAVDETMGWS